MSVVRSHFIEPEENGPRNWTMVLPTLSYGLQCFPHERYEGIVDTIVQLLYSPHLWLNRMRSRCKSMDLENFCCEGNNTMSELAKSVAQQQQERKTRTRTVGLTIVTTAVAVLAVLGAAVLFAQ